MALSEDTAEPVLADVRVDLRGRQIRVTEELLDDAQVGSSVEEVRGEGVAKCVRVRGHRGPPVDQTPDVAGTESPTPTVVEHRRAIRVERDGTGDVAQERHPAAGGCEPVHEGVARRP